MTCSKIIGQLPGYLDGALPSRTRARVREHLEDCAGCREQLERYQKLAKLLSRMAATAPPDDLPLRIRVAVAQARESHGFAGWVAAWRSRAWLVLENVLKPLALPATGGFVSAMLVFVVVLQMIVPGISLEAVPNDVPINLLRPAQVLSLSEFPSSLREGRADTDLTMQHGLLVDVTVDESGRMMDYEILSGPADAGVRRDLGQMLMFSRFRPMLSFGRPTSGGHVVLSFSEVHVRG